MPEIAERLSVESLNRRQKQQRRRGGEFICGPIPVPWLAVAAPLPGKALAVAMAVWFRAGLSRQRHDLTLCGSTLRRFGIKRLAGYRGLRALERGGLVEVERHRGRCPRVTIVSNVGRIGLSERGSAANKNPTCQIDKRRVD